LHYKVVTTGKNAAPGLTFCHLGVSIWVLEEHRARENDDLKPLGLAVGPQGFPDRGIHQRAESPNGPLPGTPLDSGLPGPVCCCFALSPHFLARVDEFDFSDLTIGA